MRNIFSLSMLVLGLAFMSYSFVSPEKTVEADAKINWLTWEEAMVKNEKNPKKMFVDVYTDWCGWCKKMDASTFKDKDVVAYMNENFYAIKLDAEMKQEVVFNGHTFKFIDNGRRGYHELAAALLDNKLSFPSFVTMNEKVERIAIIPGYQQASDLNSILKFSNLEKYKTMSYKEYKSSETK